MPSSLDTLSCTSWLVYATRATNESARRVKNLILGIKTGRIDPATGKPLAQVVLERIADRLGATAHLPFEGHPMLVPVPTSGLTKPNTVWPARRLCEELVRQGFGEDILPVLSRAIAVPKSAGRAERPRLAQHVQSLAVQGTLRPPSRLLLVDDVVTSGTTMMACAMTLANAFPGIPIAGLALSRVQSTGNPVDVLQPLVERIVISGRRCARVTP